MGNLFSQQQGPVAPTAAAMNFSNYITNNLNLSSGSDNISYPIAGLSEGPLGHSVSLHYNTGGIRVSTIASQIGLGWNLNAGGMVSRTVRGIQDDKDNGFMNATSPPSGEGAADGIDDAEPDLYHFNVGGFSGSFLIDENLNFHTIPKSNVKIEYELAFYYSDQIHRFIITDESGTKFYFGADPNGDDYLEVMSFEDQGPTNYVAGLCCDEDDRNITGWFLYKIVSFDDKHEIIFEYDRHGYMQFSMAEQMKLEHWDTSSNTGGGSTHLYLGDESDFDDVFSKFYTSSWLISKITTSNLEILFENKSFNDGSSYDREDLSGFATNDCCDPAAIEVLFPAYLESIKLNYINTTHCLEYILTQSYCEDNTTNNHGWTYDPWTKKRLKLDEIKKTSCVGGSTLEEPATKFEYYGTTGGITFFPNYLTTGIDHWGYFNDQNSSTYNMIQSGTTIDENGHQFTYGAADRTAHLEPTKKAVLNKITFPTGGFKEYLYELNDYSEQTTSSTIFALYPCSTTGGCCGSAGPESSAVYITQDVKDNSDLELKLTAIVPTVFGGSCSWTNSSLDLDIIDVNNTVVESVSINIAVTNYGYGTQYLLVPLSTLSNVLVGQTYTFEASGENQDESTFIVGLQTKVDNK